MNRSRRKRSESGDRLAWWRDAKFGMFIHWGLYAIPAGIWKGKAIEGIGEWIAFYAGIPPDEYAKLATRFNPRQFDADAWANLAKAAGMKYMVFTAKHADGFAMFQSRCSDYNVVDATPYRRDIVAELAKACRKAGLRFGVYYSQDQDLHEPDAGGYSLKSAFAASPEAYRAYTARKVMPQLTELLTRYGELDLVWFDNPINTTPESAAAIKRLVRRLQPRAIVNGRIGFNLGDYRCLGDNQSSAGGVRGDWESIATMNDTWGYKQTDHNWKQTGDMLRTLVDITSKGGTYMLNVGPTGAGVIPGESSQRLRAMGRWLEVNGEAVYGTAPSPFPYDFAWGRATVKANTLYLHIFDWPKGALCLKGLQSRVRRVRLLADPKRELSFTVGDALTIALPRRAPDRDVSVVAIDTVGAVQVDASLQQQPVGGIALPAHAGELHIAEYWGGMRVGQGGCLSDWYSSDNRVAWRFRVCAPGEFDVLLQTKAVSMAGWLGGHRVEVAVAGRKLAKTLKATAAERDGSHHFPTYTNRIGTVRLEKACQYTLELRALKINPKARGGLTASAVWLVPKGARAVRNAAAQVSTPRAKLLKSVLA
ncbi:MAG: alpha-L-fucosidase [Lentisphaerae bacterium]|nr:alpha-L-fucosidase [Lentisphaerota bacterium]